MTTITLANGRKVALTIEQKARLLTVFEIGEEGRLAVPSGSKPNSAYVVQHNGVIATSCPCQSRCRCAHEYAVDLYLEEKRQAALETARCYRDMRFDPRFN